MTELLIPENEYLNYGVQVGTHQKSSDMREFIFKVRTDGLYLLDIKKIDLRLRYAANFLNNYEPSKILVVCSRQYGQKPATLFANAIKAKVVAGRFVPGMLTNPNLPIYMEPDVLLVTDPAIDGQALKEAVDIDTPVIGFCDANNDMKNIDLVIPANNKGRRSLAVIYWLLTKEMLRLKDKEFDTKIETFEAEL